MFASSFGRLAGVFGVMHDGGYRIVSSRIINRVRFGGVIVNNNKVFVTGSIA